MEKLKLLCLHGYRQDAESFKNKTGSFRKLLKKGAECTYISAPAITGNENIAWWFSNGNHTFTSSEVTDVTEGLEDSFNTINKAVKELGPFDGIMGFSQGAAMVVLYCSMMQSEQSENPFKFAILVAAFKSLASSHSHYYDQNITIPSLHVIGDTDQVINNSKSKKITEIFEACDILHHEGGHYVPTSGSNLKKGYINFLAKFQPAETC